MILSSHVEIDPRDVPTTTPCRREHRASKTHTTLPARLIHLQACRHPPLHSQNRSFLDAIKVITPRSPSCYGMQMPFVSPTPWPSTHIQFDDAHVTLEDKLHTTLYTCRCTPNSTSSRRIGATSSPHGDGSGELLPDDTRDLLSYRPSTVVKLGGWERAALNSSRLSSPFGN